MSQSTVNDRGILGASGGVTSVSRRIAGANRARGKNRAGHKEKNHSDRRHSQAGKKVDNCCRWEEGGDIFLGDSDHVKGGNP